MLEFEPGNLFLLIQILFIMPSRKLSSLPKELLWHPFFLNINLPHLSGNTKNFFEQIIYAYEIVNITQSKTNIFSKWGQRVTCIRITWTLYKMQIHGSCCRQQNENLQRTQVAQAEADLECIENSSQVIPVFAWLWEPCPYESVIKCPLLFCRVQSILH